MKAGIVGLPNVGKSTLFNALTQSYAAQAANFPFATIEPNVGIVDVKDPRLDKLAEVSNSQKKIYATMKFVDIAWLVKWASQWEWLGNKFLANIREVDAIIQVVRYFEDPDVSHVEWKIDPLRDIEIINTELILADMAQIEDKLPYLHKKAQQKDKDAQLTYSALKKIYDALEQWKLVIQIQDQLTDAEKQIIKPYNFLTMKPFLYVLNIWEDQLCEASKIYDQFKDKVPWDLVLVSAKLEEEMIGLDEDEKKEFLSDIAQNCNKSPQQIPTLNDLIKTAFDRLGLTYFFTSWEKESRAWTIKKWTKAPQAAWVIHTDFEKWFVKAEVVNWQDFVQAGWWHKAREKGLVRLEGKEYEVQDGDVILFRFAK